MACDHLIVKYLKQKDLYCYSIPACPYNLNHNKVDGYLTFKRFRLLRGIDEITYCFPVINLVGCLRINSEATVQMIAAAAWVLTC